MHADRTAQAASQRFMDRGEGGRLIGCKFVGALQVPRLDFLCAAFTRGWSRGLRFAKQCIYFGLFESFPHVGLSDNGHSLQLRCRQRLEVTEKVGPPVCRALVDPAPNAVL